MPNAQIRYLEERQRMWDMMEEDSIKAIAEQDRMDKIRDRQENIAYESRMKKLNDPYRPLTYQERINQKFDNDYYPEENY